MPATTTFRQIAAASVSDKEVARMIDVLTAAFLTYHAHVDIWGSDWDLSHELMTGAVKHNLERHDVWVAEQDGEITAVALWVPPGHEWMTEEEMVPLMGPLLTKVPPEIGAWAVGEMFPGMEELQNSVSPHCSRDWDYLAMFGVDPAHQGKGIGSAFLQHERAWISGPIGLATQTEQNVRFYEKNGWVLKGVKEYTVPNGKPWVDRFLVSVT